MSQEKIVYQEVPAGAVFESAQMALRKLNMKIEREDQHSNVITAKSGRTKYSFGQNITVAMVEVGTATEVSITTKSGQITDWGEGKKLISEIFQNIEEGIANIRAEGRITKPKAPTYSMGQQHEAGRPSEKQVTTENAAKSSSNSSNWILRIAAALGILWVLNTEQGASFIQSIFGSFSVETNIMKYDCDKVAALFKGEVLQNSFGGQFKIIKISDTTKVSKSINKIVCNTTMQLSNGKTQSMKMTVEKTPGSDEIMYRAEPR